MEDLATLVNVKSFANFGYMEPGKVKVAIASKKTNIRLNDVKSPKRAKTKLEKKLLFTISGTSPTNQ